MKGPGDKEWKAILDGELGERGEAAVADIAASLANLPADDPTADASLSGGLAGQGLFFAYLARSSAVQGHGDAMIERIDTAIDALATQPMGDGLYSGFPGIAWTVAHLNETIVDDEGEGEDPNDDIDEVILERLSLTPWPGEYDLISGLVGLGVYAVERLPKPRAVACLAQVVDRLGELAERPGRLATWHTPPAHLPPWQRERAPAGYHNLGLAHGIPGVVALLAAISAAGHESEASRALLEGAVAWLLEQRLPEGADACWDSWLVADVEPTPARSAWCYGDPGVAAAVMLAGFGTGNDFWVEVAVDVMGKVARRPRKGAGVIDTGLCHGAAGLAHVFNRFYQATGVELFADAARTWFERTLEMRDPERGVAGFPCYMPNPDGTPRWVDEAGLLTGAAGVGLALLAATTSVAPAWDRHLLLSLPDRGR